mgnify:CR=1 FL=1
MFFKDSSNNRYFIGRSFTHDGIQYTTAAATEAKFTALGFTKVTIAAKPDTRFYAVTGPDINGAYTSTARDLANLKTRFIEETKSAERARLRPSDYYIVQNTEGLTDVVDKVGSVVGVELLSGGSGYNTTPFVTITDSCGMGYGGFAKANINAKGEVTSITVISSGTMYPVGEEVPHGIVDAEIEDPGSNYSPTDTIDGFDIVVKDGKLFDLYIFIYY